MSLLSALLDLIFPAKCPFCGRVLMDGCTLTASDGIQVEPFGYERNDCRVVR